MTEQLRKLGYESVTDWMDDLWANRGEAHRDHLRRWNPEFAALPPEVVPWPYRSADAPAPTHCPKCGRALLHYWWGGDQFRSGYHVVGCAGWLQGLLRHRPGWLFTLQHWELTVGKDDVTKRRSWLFDPLSGEPMDGHR